MKGNMKPIKVESGTPALVTNGASSRMHTGIKFLSVIVLSFLTTQVPTNADPNEKSQQGSAEFARMKALVGTWHGKADMGQGMMEFTVEYRLVAGGTALEERIFAGTPKEMVTMYHDQHGKLALTHYCMLGNRPGMLLKSSDNKTLNFDFDDSCGVDAKAETHMHSLSITFDDNDTITQTWRLFSDGKAKDDHPFTLKRV
jgi:hypothetical protein